MKNLLTKGLLLCTLVAVISTGCTKQNEVMEQPNANEMAPVVQEKVMEPTAVQPVVNPAEETPAEAEQPAEAPATH